MQINSNICILTIDEIDNETDYDIRLKTMKRVSSFFLPAYQSFKTNKLATSSSFKVN